MMMNNGIQRWVPIGAASQTLTGGVVAAALCLGLIAGTGGEIPLDQVKGRSGTGSVRLGSAVPSTTSVQRGLAADLTAIRGSLRLSVAELAELFGVTRPTIYSWQSGKASNEAHAARARDLASAIETHGAFLAGQSGRIAHRAVQGRTTAFDLLRTGGDAKAILATLARVLQHEAAQRDRLARRLQSRSGTRGVADTDAIG